MGNEKTGDVILVGSDADLDFLIPQRSRGNERINRRNPYALIVLRGIAQFEDLRLGQNDTPGRNFAFRFKNRRIALDQRDKARENLIRRFVLALQSTQRHLRQIAGREIWRANQHKGITQEVFSLDLLA